MSVNNATSNGQFRLVLASGSPRRCDILNQLGLRFDVHAADIDETEQIGERADVYVRRLAETKAATVAKRLEPSENITTVVLAADTTVALEGMILGKPNDADDAHRMLTMLQGTTHDVFTGIAISVGDATRTEVVRTVVTMAAMDDDDIVWYIESGEPFDKAGSYAIQGSGGSFVRSITGNLQNVVGLPMVETADLLGSFDLKFAQFR
jgi:septum formation protein